ncbi:cyclic nucleotide-binding/CBS domain-containing protein [Candidatus Riflebacteria bacterium]
MKTAMDIIKKMQLEMVSVPAETTIFEALQIMVELKIGAILIMEEHEILGIWTERDLMYNSIQPDFVPRTARISDYMSTNLKTVPHTASIYNLMDRFLDLGIRHLLIEKNGKCISLLSIRDIVKACLDEKTKEIEDLNSRLRQVF